MEDLPRFRFGPFELDTGAFKLLRDGASVPLEPKALDLLRLLVERAPNVVDKAEIFSRVWKDVAVTDNALTRLIAQLRKALDDDPRGPRYIETIATKGYRFIAAVEPAGDAARTPPPPSPMVAAPVRAGSRRRQIAAATAGTAAVLLALAWIGARSPADGDDDRSPAALRRRPDIARFAALKPEQATIGRSYDGFLAFAPDGRSFAYTSDASGALEIYVQDIAPGSSPSPLTANGRQNIEPTWSPDGRFIAFHEMAGNGIWVMPSRGGVARKISDFGSRPSWSPDGRRIAFQSLSSPLVDGLGGLSVPGALSTIWICDAADGGHAVRVTEPADPAGPHLTPAWLPDSRHLLFTATSNLTLGGVTSLWNVDVETGRRQRVVSHPRLTQDYALSPDGEAVYFVARGADTLWWLPLGENGTWKADPQPTGLPVNSSRIAHVAVAADGHRVAWTGIESGVGVWAGAPHGEGEGGAAAAPVADALGVRYGLPTPASDGRIALIGGRAGSVSHVFLIAPPLAIRQLTVDASNHGGPQWLPGERELAYVSYRDGAPLFSAIDPDTGRTRTLFSLSDVPGPPGESQPSTASAGVNVAFTRDFSKLAMGIVRDGRPNVWVAGLSQMRPDGTVAQRTFVAEGGSYPVWSHDGRWIAYQCSEGGDTHVCVTGAEGGEAKRLTHEPGQSWVGGWKPDGDTILFAAQRSGVWNVRSVSRTTGAERMLTHFTVPRGYVRYPRWDAARGRVLFERSETTARTWWVAVP
jgi:Tol biopolymer transport system component/DNA-binding winged helix-turn-helix (wHTH) protein